MTKKQSKILTLSFLILILALTAAGSFYLTKSPQNAQELDTSTVTLSNATSTSATNTAPVLGTPPKAPSNTATERTTPKVTKTNVEESNTQRYTDPTGTLCNNTYWGDCPAGQDFICPQTGDAYCESTAETQEEIDPHDWCVNNYGKYATYDTQSNACSCSQGYEVNTSDTACVRVEVAQQQNVPVQEEQPDLSINKSACDTASNNLISFEKNYSGAVASASFTGSAPVAQGNVAKIQEQYSAMLPTYQLLKQAACQIPASDADCQKIIAKYNSISQNNLFGPNSYEYLQFGLYNNDIYYSCQ
jgi:hypothetical protein